MYVLVQKLKNSYKISENDGQGRRVGREGATGTRGFCEHMYVLAPVDLGPKKLEIIEKTIFSCMYSKLDIGTRVFKNLPNNAPLTFTQRQNFSKII